MQQIPGMMMPGMGISQPQPQPMNPMMAGMAQAMQQQVMMQQ